MAEKTTTTKQTSRPPIVAVLGHVDHGKTSLLDTIRKTNITESEAGGITQHIGAYQIETTKTKEKRKITFIDTPGHEAFSKMRSRGSQIADIALLVIAATEGVKPQTEESIKHIKAAGIPMIVVLNKMDLPEANPDKVIQQLASKEILVEKFGGDILTIPVSAKAGTGISELLEAILLVTDMKGVLTDQGAAFSGTIIEAKLDKNRGPLATIIVKNGTLSIGKMLYAEAVEAKVRAMVDSMGNNVKEASPSFPVEIMGWKSVPQVGVTVTEVPSDKKSEEKQIQAKAFSLPPLVTVKKLKLIIKADVLGSLEAIKESLGESVEIIQSATGAITESDILMAKSTGSIVIGFNVKPNAKMIEFAKTEKVRMKTYTIIYELLEELGEVIEVLSRPDAQEPEIGIATILAEFISSGERVAGCRIESGRMVKNDNIKLMRKDVEIGRTKIKSLRRAKDDTIKIEEGQECGILLDKKLDFKLGDRIIAFKQPEILT